MSNIDEIQLYINYLLLPQIEKKAICKIFEYIKNFDTDDINPIRSQLAELFCICSSKLTKELAEDTEVSDCVSSAFRNIKRILTSDNTEFSLKDEKKSYLLVIYFLTQIQNLQSSSKNPTEQMQSLFENLCEKLDAMHWLFRIEQDGEKLFPIGKLLNFVINREDFFIGNLDDVTFYTFLLALEVFDTTQYDKEKRKVEGLIDSYHLDCLKLLNKPNVLKVGGNIGWRDNFKKNGTLTLLIPQKDSFDIYIRHCKKTYFDQDIAISQLYSEHNSRNETIAYFCYISYKEKIEYNNISNLFEKEDLTIWRQICRLIFSERKMNVFLDNSFVKVNGNWIAANPFVANDKMIISENGEKCHSIADMGRLVKDFLAPFFIYRAKGVGFDYVMLGSIFYLLWIDSRPVDKIFDLLDNPDVTNLQQSVINKWAENVSNYESSVTQLKSEYFASVEYAKKRDSIVLKKINEVLWLPYKFPCACIQSYLRKKMTENLADEIILIEVVQNFNGFEYFDKKKNLKIDYDIDFEDTYLKTTGEFCVIFDKSKLKYIYKPEIDKIFKLNKSIEQENLLLPDVDNFTGINEFEIENVINKYMSLHEDALKENSYNKDFKSVAYLRLFHHLLYCQIFGESKWGKFYNLLHHHQLVKFNTFKNDVPQLQESTTLVVPKERQNTGNTLVSIYNKYGLTHSVRTRSIFDRKIDKNNLNKYCLENGNVIKKVVILFDTLQSGTSTKRVLNMYFDNDFHEKTNICFFCEGNPVYLDEIISENHASLEIISLYGTDEGKTSVDAFVRQSTTVLNQAKKIEIKHKIQNRANEEFLKNAKEIYPQINENSFDDAFYPIIREFNQPKKNIFPNELLRPDNIASIFVKKDEF